MAIINSIFTFVEYTKKIRKMFEFQQYLGFLLFLTILTMGFWLMIFLINFVFYWVGGYLWNEYKEKRANRESLKQ
ncbi:hypothetical protein FC1_04460 [Flavobacterium columnare NBRC 100251 = ATCC 23463]|nr:hypothetical protein FC1_04460 [Flavobacterium columnare NBRC 100251 = ATCC 23463]